MHTAQEERSKRDVTLTQTKPHTKLTLSCALLLLLKWDCWPLDGLNCFIQSTTSGAVLHLAASLSLKLHFLTLNRCFLMRCSCPDRTLSQ